MAKSGTAREIHLACAAAGRAGARETRLQRIPSRLGRWAARTSACALGITVASMVAAQNVYGQDRINHKNFKFAPNLPEFEAEAAAEATEKAFYVPLITGSFVVAGVILFFWFTLGPGRKSKFTQD